MSKTKIEWTNEVWNPVTGCTPCSPGCTHCYAKRMARRLAGRHGYPEAPHHFDVTLRPERLEQPLRRKKPTMYFVCSMSDLFHKDVPFDFVDLVFLTMTACNGIHFFQLLTKRPGRMLEYFNSRQYYSSEQYHAHSLPNIWLGVSVENQAAANSRREYLEQCPAAVKFVSYEPALAPVDWTGWEFVSQIISGGESGPGARPSHPDWHRATRDFCQANEIAYFFKAWGEWMGMDYTGAQIAGDGAECFRWSGVPMPPFLPGESIGKNHRFNQSFGASRIGKKRAGRLLDGRTWQQFPVASGAGK